MVRTLDYMATDMVKVLVYFQWILEKVRLVLQHLVRRNHRVPAHLVAKQFLEAQMIVPGVEREFTRLKKNSLQEE